LKTSALFGDFVKTVFDTALSRMAGEDDDLDMLGGNYEESDDPDESALP
jgi:hypothetical protein